MQIRYTVSLLLSTIILKLWHLLLIQSGRIVAVRVLLRKAQLRRNAEKEPHDYLVQNVVGKI